MPTYLMLASKTAGPRAAASRDLADVIKKAFSHATTERTRGKRARVELWYVLGDHDFVAVIRNISEDELAQGLLALSLEGSLKTRTLSVIAYNKNLAKLAGDIADGKLKVGSGPVGGWEG